MEDRKNGIGLYSADNRTFRRESKYQNKLDKIGEGITSMEIDSKAFPNKKRKEDGDEIQEEDGEETDVDLVIDEEPKEKEKPPHQDANIFVQDSPPREAPKPKPKSEKIKIKENADGEIEIESDVEMDRPKTPPKKDRK